MVRTVEKKGREETNPAQAGAHLDQSQWAVVSVYASSVQACVHHRLHRPFAFEGERQRDVSLEQTLWSGDVHGRIHPHYHLQKTRKHLHGVEGVVVCVVFGIVGDLKMDEVNS